MKGHPDQGQMARVAKGPSVAFPKPLEQAYAFLALNGK